jgi:hypothetical protein
LQIATPSQKDTTMRILPTRLSRSAAGLAATAVILLTLAGCSAPADSTAAPGASGGSGGSAASDAEFSAARDAYDLKLAQCIRGKGLDVKDPQPGQGIQESSEEINAAASICMKEIGDPPVFESPMDDSEILATHLKWAACFRELGYEVEEPVSGQAFVSPADATDEDYATCTDPAL